MEALVSKTRSLRPFLSRFGGAYMCQIRDFNIAKYKTKKQRINEKNISPDNKKWAISFLDGMERLKELDLSEPHMIHIVTRTKPLIGRPWWEKEIIAELGLDVKCHKPVLLKNIPGVNKMLNEVKHLLKILPLKMPYGLPHHPKEFENITLKSNGELVFQKYLDCQEEGHNLNLGQGEQVASDSKNNVNKWKFEMETLQNYLDRQVQLYRVNIEQFPTKYEYKLNQDGKMFRYAPKDVRKHSF